MSDIRRSSRSGETDLAQIFAALGDPTRLALVAKLTAGPPLSISDLARDSTMTRQAITKHLQVLERAGVVERSREGRESHYRLDPSPMLVLRTYLDDVARHWDDALGRLKSFVEE